MLLRIIVIFFKNKFLTKNYSLIKIKLRNYTGAEVLELDLVSREIEISPGSFWDSRSSFLEILTRISSLTFG